MRFHALALAGCASVFLSSPARAEGYAPPPKLVLDDVIGFGTSGNTGWLGYQRGASTYGSIDAPAHSTISSVFIAPRFEVLFGKYLSLGAQLAYSRTASGSDSVSSNGTYSMSAEQNAFTLLPIVGVRIPLPRAFSLWAHAGFGGGAAVTHVTSRAPLDPVTGLTDAQTTDTAQLLTRARVDVRVGFEPVRGVMLVAGPELQRATASQTNGEFEVSQLSLGLWGGVSFVIR